MIWNIRSTSLTFESPLVIGILNLTPDSFYDGGRLETPAEALAWALRLAGEGADILDLGAESTRPGAKPVTEEEELARLIPALRAISSAVQIPISVDTTKPCVAREALRAGAHIVNDVSGLRMNPEMADVVREFGAGLILMHRRGTPETMQSLAHYEHLVEEVIAELEESVETALSRGVSFTQIVLDPGIGFSKTAEQNLELMAHLDAFRYLNRPILIGPSRKSFLGVVTGSGPSERLFGTVGVCVLAFERGARLFRVHDVKPVKEALQVADAILKGCHSEAKGRRISEILRGVYPEMLRFAQHDKRRAQDDKKQ